ncbi:DeoR/GlpR family DNA-binding transcription regulator [Lichenifustis flavocetrariae]|uniref:DeoR/GlpR family DNA-binding transcription regulator n=1 Tax=Lichenifustis flavocetrariae TaxID=2949735 RepID=A0AA42CL44_9HYPH|nr:DeoR/GlpR family DNA-binding transcription regulator [Lichenifustis flavocetrariae]MCW6506935.1 DeoR/GlpR family DNA-binding transcription regulator [Lichenifustis flavocetrariae]
MLAHVRRASILETVRQTGSVQVAEIAGRLAVSEMTIRRDLVDLEREGHLKRLHGGAVALQGIAVDREEPSFDARLSRDRGAKERVAAAALPLVDDARTVALDVGATAFLLAQLLRARVGLHLFTNSLRIAAALSDGAQQVFVPGGRVRGTEMAIGGPDAVAAFAKLWFDVAFLGVSGLTADGLFDYSIEDTEVKRVYLGRSSRKVVLCDASKFQRMSLVRVAGFDTVDTLVTDAMPPPDIQAALDAAGVEVILAPPAASSGA